MARALLNRQQMAHPETLGRYRIESEIGHGMMGIVYKATDPLLGRTVAVKVVNPALPIPEDERLVLEQRFLREASLAAGLSHPNIVVVHDVGCDEASHIPFIALEHLEGFTLAERMARGHGMDWRQAVRIVASLADALQHAQSRGIVHRDVKPSNIMILPSGLPKILDFGIARAASAELTGGDEFWGSPAYMSPEQASGYVVDGRTDLFSLGSVLYELLSGRRAFEGEGIAEVVYRVVNDDPPTLSTVRPGLPRALDHVLARALAKDPADRYADGRELADALNAILRAEDLVTTARSGIDTLTFRLTRPQNAFGALSTHRLLQAAGAVAIVGLSALPLSSAGGSLPLTGAAPVAVSSPLGVALASPPTPAILPALLALSVEHSEKRGRLKVWIDDEVSVDRALTSTQSKKLLFLKRNTGRIATVLSVAPGTRKVRIEVRGDGATRTRSVTDEFKSGESRTLQVKVGSAIQTEWVH